MSVTLSVPERLSALATRALNKLDGSQLQRLRDTKLWRRRSEYFLNIAYPSMQVMESVTSEAVLGDMSELDTSDGVALYVHVPFCRANCFYCHYYKLFHQSSEQVSRYLDSLDTELSLVRASYGPLSARSVYIGGGTPSYCTAEQIRRLFEIIRKHVEIRSDAEVSFEMHPENGDAERMRALRDCGVTRLSMGVESFDETILAHENRRHTAADARRVYGLAVDAGFENINLDLIYGLQGQTLENWERSLDALGELRPASCTMYFLRLKQGTPEFKLWVAGHEGFPPEDELLLMHAMNFERMEAELGYHQNPVDWFIRDDRYFHSYQDHNWRRSDEFPLIGCGPSAYSAAGGWQYYNVNDLATWSKTLASGRLPIWRGEKLVHEERMRRTIMLGLKCSIDRGIFVDTYGVDPVVAFPAEWSRLVELELVEIDETRIALTYLGKLFADEAGREFYSQAILDRMSAVDASMISTTWPMLNK